MTTTALEHLALAPQVEPHQCSGRVLPLKGPPREPCLRLPKNILR
jgi:hypothetical protein